jgi:hypothetical protein
VGGLEVLNEFGILLFHPCFDPLQPTGEPSEKDGDKNQANRNQRNDMPSGILLRGVVDKVESGIWCH